MRSRGGEQNRQCAKEITHEHQNVNMGFPLFQMVMDQAFEIGTESHAS